MTIGWDGLSRDCLLPVPEGLGGHPALADRESALVAYRQATGKAWRGGDRRGAAARDDVDDERADCADDRVVELITIADAGHQWLGSTRIRDGVDSSSDRLDATATIGDFFSAVG